MRYVKRRVVGVGVAIAIAMPVMAACSSTNHGRPPSAAGCVDPSTAPTMKIALDSIHANIWNAGGQTGEAAQIGSQLSWRGVHIISTGNDPSNGKTPAHAQIRYGANGKQIALTLAQQIKDATLEQDNRTNPSVDVVIGSHFSLIPVPPPAPSRVTVNVLNAFVIPGTASDVAKMLRKRGFHTAKIGNTSDYYPDNAVIIRYGLQGDPAARRLALQFKNAKMEQDGRKGATVDMVIGSKWADSAIVSAAQATPKPAPKSSAPTCAPAAK
jgi:hypothetical protein